MSSEQFNTEDHNKNEVHVHYIKHDKAAAHSLLPNSGHHYITSNHSIFLSTDNDHPSRLFSSALSLADAAVVAPPVIDLSAANICIETTKGPLLLDDVAEILEKDPEQREVLFDETIRKSIRKKCYLQALCVAVSSVLALIGFLGIRNAQPSLGGDQQLSMFTWAMFYIMMPIGGFFSMAAIHRFGPRWTFVLSMIPFALYPVALYYPAYFTTLPLSGLCGAMMVVYESNDSTYILHLATLYSLSSGLDIVDTFGRFKSFTTAAFYFSNSLGGLISSLLLSDMYTIPGEISGNSSHPTKAVTSLAELNISCQLSYTYQTSLLPPTAYISKQYLLFGVLGFLSISGLILFSVGINNVRGIGVTSKGGFVRAFKSFVSTFFKLKTLCLYPIAFSIGFATSVVLIDYVTAFITCPYGVSSANVVLMVGSLCSAIGSLVSGLFIGKLGRPITCILGLGTVVSAYIMMYLYESPFSKLSADVFAPSLLASVGQGMLANLNYGIVTAVYPTDTSAGISVYQTVMAAGAVIGSQAVARGWLLLSTKLFIGFGLCALWLLVVVLIDFLLKREMLKL